MYLFLSAPAKAMEFLTRTCSYPYCTKKKGLLSIPSRVVSLFQNPQFIPLLVLLTHLVELISLSSRRGCGSRKKNQIRVWRGEDLYGNSNKEDR